MNIRAIKTRLVEPGEITVEQLLTESLPEVLPEKSIVAITSKVVSLCENRVRPLEGTDKEALIQRESDFFMPEAAGKYGINFTVTNNTLIPNAGVDESNANGVFVLWPDDAVRSANVARSFLREHYGVREIGVVITDSTCRPLRLGVGGIAIGFSGFAPIKDYVGSKDLYGRDFKVERTDVAGGLAGAAVLVMGEGAEQTPLALLEAVDFVVFQDNDPTPEELATLRIPIEDDLFEPFLGAVTWHKSPDA